MGKNKRRGYVEKQQVISLDIELDDLSSAQKALREVIKESEKLSKKGYELNNDGHKFGARLKIKIFMIQDWD